MAPKGTVTEVPAAAARRTAITAARGALQTTYSAANLVNSIDKESARMLRTAEGLARSAIARLEFLSREEAVKKKDQEKEKKDDDANAAGATAAASARPRRRGRRACKVAPLSVSPETLPLAKAPSSPLAADSGVRASGRTMKQQHSRERSPRRGVSPATFSPAAVSHPGADDGPGLG